MRPAHATLPALLLLAATACLVPGPRGRMMVVAPVPVVHIGYVDREPPPVRYERAPPPPSYDHVWVPGYWSWNAGAYLWVPGAYRLRPRPGAVWVEGRWNRHERGWHWMDGHWR